MSKSAKPIIVAAGTFALATLAVHAWAYYFLLDDFTITRQAASQSIWQLLSRPQFGFYRPVSDLWLKALYALCAWRHPSTYIAASLAVHGVNTWLVTVLARRAGLDRTAAAFAGVFFLASPWASEPVLWVAASCDSLPTLGLLVCTIAALEYVQPHDTEYDSRFRHAAFWVGVLGAIEAVLSKELGAIAPALVVVAIAGVRGPRALLQPRAVRYVGTVVLAVVAYLLFRQSILPGLGGAYGTLRTLVGRSSLLWNLRSFGVALVVLPFPDSVAAIGRAVVSAAIAVFAAGSVALLFVAALSRWRLAVTCVGGMLASLAPVLWATLVPGNTSGNRFLYLAGAWFAIMLAAGLERFRPTARTVAAAAMLIVALASVVYQTRVWRSAFALSRTTIAQLRQYDRSESPIFVTNLPGLFADGAYVLNSVSVAAHFGGTLPPVEANRMAIKFDRGEPIFSFWLDERRNARADERAVTLNLPVWMPETRPFEGIDAPAANAEVAQPFTIRGWAIDANARAGTGVQSVNVYAYPLPGSEDNAAPLGRATYGEARPDIARRFGDRFVDSGFRLNGSGLAPGRYRIVVRTRRTLARGADVPLTVDVTVK